MPDPFRNVQYPERLERLERSEWGTVIRPAQIVPGQHGPGHIPRNYTRIEARRRRYQRNSQDLGRAIKAVLQGGRCRRAAEAGSAVESFLTYDPPLIRKAWIRMWGWYKDAVDRPPPQSRVAHATMTAEMGGDIPACPTARRSNPCGSPSFLGG